MPNPVSPVHPVSDLNGEEMGASPLGSGYSAEPEPVPVSALTGEYPSRDGLIAKLLEAGRRCADAAFFTGMAEAHARPELLNRGDISAEEFAEAEKQLADAREEQDEALIDLIGAFGNSDGYPMTREELAARLAPCDEQPKAEDAAAAEPWKGASAVTDEVRQAPNTSPDPLSQAEDLCDRLDRLNTVSDPQACADAMDEARLQIILLGAKVAELKAHEADLLDVARKSVTLWQNKLSQALAQIERLKANLLDLRASRHAMETRALAAENALRSARLALSDQTGGED